MRKGEREKGREGGGGVKDRGEMEERKGEKRRDNEAVSRQLEPYMIKSL